MGFSRKKSFSLKIIVQDEKNQQERFKMKQQQSPKSVNFEDSLSSCGLGIEETELNFDLGDFEADFDVPQVDLNVGEI